MSRVILIPIDMATAVIYIFRQIHAGLSNACIHLYSSFDYFPPLRRRRRVCVCVCRNGGLTYRND